MGSFSIERIVGFVAIVTLIVLGIHNGGKLSQFMDTCAILIVVGTMVGGFLMSAGPRTGAAFGAAFSKVASKDRLQVGLRAYHTARLCALAGGFFAAVAGLLIVLRNLDDPGSIGPGIALALLGLFWAIFLSYFILRPLQAGIERRLAEAGETEAASSETPLDLLVLGGVFLMVLISFRMLIVALGK